jgi:hypothetical protein
MTVLDVPPETIIYSEVAARAPLSRVAGRYLAGGFVIDSN